MTTALYIGRFQPFHNGHADAIGQIFKTGVERIVIGIGSAEENFIPENPLTAGERFEILENALQELGYSSWQYAILPIRNIHHYALWPHHVVQLCPPFSTVFSGSSIVESLWEKANIPGVSFQKLMIQKPVSATLVREKLKKNENISGLVPKSVEEWCKAHEVGERLKKIEN
ncbi:MAG: nicotinamide-nucleotide adenylyltransferase [Candidatus Peregrinibacteria bacterium]